MIENLGVITHMFLLELAIPANVELFFSQLFPLIAFDMLFMDVWSDKIFKFSAYSMNSSLNYQFGAVGYGSTLVIMVLGDKFYYIFSGPLLILCIKLLTIYFKRCRCCKRPHNYFKS